MIGKVISHYKISDKLGEGGMGVVYKAEDTRLRRTVALKFLPKDLMGDSEARERLLREAQATSALDHPNICTTYEIDESEGETFISMAYIDGKSLEDRIKSGPMTVEEAVDITIQAAEGLEEAHENGVVHRDIKSSNIMLTRKGHVRIMDFGLAKLAGRSKLTRTATVMGTLYYMSPEQARGEPLDHRTDIWSLGVVLYEMLTGKHAFNAENEAALLHKIIYEEPADIGSLKPDIPQGLAAVVDKAMTKNRDNRYTHVSELIDDLRNHQTLKTVRVPAEPVKPPSPQPQSQSLIEKLSTEDPEAFKRVERRVRVKMKFYKHLYFYLTLNGLLLLINLLTWGGYIWMKWPAMALGVPLAFHAIRIYGFDHGLTVRDRLMEKEIKKETSRK